MQNFETQGFGKSTFCCFRGCRCLPPPVRIQPRRERHRQRHRPFRCDYGRAASDQIGASAPVPSIVLLTFGIALIVGLWFYRQGGHRHRRHQVWRKCAPASGFTAELSAASVVMAASMLGLPVSSTHISGGGGAGHRPGQPPTPTGKR